MASCAGQGDRGCMVLRTLSAALWFFASWSLGAAGTLYFDTDERLGIIAGAAIVLLILHREIVAVGRAIASTTGVIALPRRSEEAERTAPPL